LRGEQDLGLEACFELRLPNDFFAQNFDRHGPSVADDARAKYCAHTALAKQSLDPILARYKLANHLNALNAGLRPGGCYDT
jgi:hypothetical protein